VDGEPIAVRTSALPRALSTGARRDEPAERYRGLAVETVGDRFPGCGPLAGIHAALA
jgi:molybdopterin-guanine dinucleotide biosynthesis protein A